MKKLHSLSIEPGHYLSLWMHYCCLIYDLIFHCLPIHIKVGETSSKCFCFCADLTLHCPRLNVNHHADIILSPELSFLMAENISVQFVVQVMLRTQIANSVFYFEDGNCNVRVRAVIYNYDVL